MAPTMADYFIGLRRLWWLPLATLVIGLAAGAFLFTQTRAVSSTTTVSALFTFRVEDAGTEAAGSARESETAVAQQRLASYVQLARASAEVEALIAGTPGGSVDIALADHGAATGTPPAPGLVTISVGTGGLQEAAASPLAQDVTAEVVEQVISLDARQQAPSLQPEVLIADPQTSATGPGISGLARVAMVVILLLGLGLAAVYLVVWLQGRINSRKDIEERLGARVLADLAGRPGDDAAAVLAISKGRPSPTTALLCPVPTTNGGTAATAQTVASAAKGLGLQLDLRTPASAIVPEGPADLILIDATAHGFDADTMRAAASADLIALIVEYGRTNYRDLDRAARTLAELSEADIAVIGVAPSAAAKSARL